MKFEELKKSLNTLQPIYYIKGSDAFLRHKATEIIIDASVKFKDLNIIRYNDENTDFGGIISNCNQTPMMDEKKVVILDNLAVKKAEELKSITDYCKHPQKSTVLIIIDTNGSAAYKGIEKLATVVDCAPLGNEMLSKLILSELKKTECKINTDALTAVIEYCNHDYTRISNEVNKLINLVGKGGLIDKETVDNVVTRDVEFDIFELGNAVSKRNGKKAIQIAEALMQRKESPQMLLMLIQNNFRRMFYAINTKETNCEIATKLGVKEWSIKMARDSAAGFSPAKLKRILDLGAQLDYKIKAGEMSDENALIYFVTQCVAT